MEHLTNQKVIRELMEQFGFSFSKSLGQNFLINPSVCPRIAEQGGANAETGVLEIGAGFGVLTHELALRAKKVVVVELDSRLLPVLDHTLQEHQNIEIINQDILKVDLPALFAQAFSGMRVVVCANLPYYITSPILLRLLEQRLPVQVITAMVQKEAAERLCAPMPSRACGAVTAAVRYYSEPKILFPVSRGSFYPSPNVDSAVIQLKVREKLPLTSDQEQVLFETVRAGFSMRRKTLLNGISNSQKLQKEQVREAILSVGLSEQIRPEQLSMEDWIRLSDRLQTK